MTPIIEALVWRGINPPPAGSRKTLCPHCSLSRQKADERCLSIYPRKESVEWRCHHCGWEGKEEVAA